MQGAYSLFIGKTITAAGSFGYEYLMHFYESMMQMTM